jgi:hypothetical protein
MCNYKEPWADFVGYDLLGYEYNCKYPPNKELYGAAYDGYASPNQLTFFYDFCIHQYGVAFYYNGENYETEFTNHGPILTNKSTNEVQGPFDDAVHLLEQSELNGKKLITVIDSLENVDLH